MELIGTLEWSINHMNGLRGQLRFSLNSRTRNLPFEMDFLRLGSVLTWVGGSTFDSTGRRHSAADLLSYVKTSNNIMVTVHVIVERVLLATSLPYPPLKPSAIGVVYRDQRGGFHHAILRDKGEVLLSARALGSPQLLLLSGAYLEAVSNVIPFSAPSYGAFVRSSLFSVYFTLATLMEKIVGTLSAGSLRLASTDVKVNPIVRFNYFRNPGDVERCVNGTQKIHDVLKSRSMEEF
ncbi:hypothetical protein M9H77_23652 [Catharanthus roseus]|uniref:Uncharacterized protein n=1 Tax=Catharanthus roseus TaxID=4058 RepID=A0ACC0ATV5_CATRO|nr:hypothetical protein M9H77_23652 [Catharanthus roseus]